MEGLPKERGLPPVTVDWGPSVIVRLALALVDPSDTCSGCGPDPEGPYPRDYSDCCCGWEGAGGKPTPHPWNEYIRAVKLMCGMVVQIQLGCNGTLSIWAANADTPEKFQDLLEKTEIGEPQQPHFKYKEGKWNDMRVRDNPNLKKMKEVVERCLSKTEPSWTEKVVNPSHPPKGALTYATFEDGSSVDMDLYALEVLTHFVKNAGGQMI